MYQLNEEQLNIIIISIQGMLDQARVPAQILDAICDPDYLKGRAKYPLSAIVYSGFDVENQSIPDITIQKIQYGRGRFMPELYSKDVVFQIYNKIKAFGDRFEVLLFQINRDTYILEKLEQISFDGFTDTERAKVAKRKVLYG